MPKVSISTQYIFFSFLFTLSNLILGIIIYLIIPKTIIIIRLLEAFIRLGINLCKNSSTGLHRSFSESPLRKRPLEQAID